MSNRTRASILQNFDVEVSRLIADSDFESFDELKVKVDDEGDTKLLSGSMINVGELYAENEEIEEK